MDTFEFGDLVATTRTLQNRNVAGAALPANTPGLVADVGPVYVRVEIGGDRCIHVRPDDLFIVEKAFVTDYVTVESAPRLADVWDLWAESARALHTMKEHLASLVESTRASDRLARPGN